NFSNSLQLGGINVSVSGHSHSTNDITNFNSSVSGLLPVQSISGSGNISVINIGRNFTIGSSGLIKSDTTGIASASGINNIVVMSQVDYDSLVSKDSNTIYFIT
ncbi:hypothetical protein EBU95_11775, partial [bacterium]|nr:hypothetical protein [bacterium]